MGFRETLKTGGGLRDTRGRLDGDHGCFLSGIWRTNYGFLKHTAVRIGGFSLGSIFV